MTREQKFAEITANLTKTWNITNETGYKPISNCWGIMTYSEREFSVEGMKTLIPGFWEKFKKADFRFITEFVIVMNHKSWEHAETNVSLAKLYNDYYHKYAAWCEENFDDAAMEYYFKTTD